MPDWVSTGLAPETLISYQRVPSRSPDAEPTPPLVTAMLCAVQRRPLRRVAAMSRSSSASSCPAVPPALPWCGTLSGSAVAGTLSEMFAEIPDGGQLPVEV